MYIPIQDKDNATARNNNDASTRMTQNNDDGVSIS